MDTFTIIPGRSWLIRLCGRHPLVRTSDRIEAAVTAVLLLSVILVLPVAAAVSTSVHEHLTAEYALQQESRLRVAAVAQSDGDYVPEPYSVHWLTPVRWEADGVGHTDVLESDTRLKTGDSVDIWIDHHGQRVPPPPSAGQAGIAAFCAGASVWVAIAACAGLVQVLIRRTLDRRRFAQWTTELDDVAGNGGNPTKRHT